MTVERYELPALAPADPTGGRLVRWAEAMAAAQQLGEALAATAFVPDVFQGHPNEAAAAIMYGDEIGFTPGQALQNIYVVYQRPALYARAMRALVLAAGHEMWTDVRSPQRVIVCGQRKGSTHVERVEWTTTRAKQAGYDRNPMYARDPEAMLYARASGDVARAVAPDALAGLVYSVEELQLQETAAEPTKTVIRSDQPKTARRAQPTASAPAPPLDEPTTRTQTSAGPPPAEDAGEADSSPPASPAPISDPMHRQLQKLFKEKGITTSDDRHIFAASIIGHTIGSTREMTIPEGQDVYEALKKLPETEASS